jgi:transcriptional regulator of acetoin/glycerol metabolism
MVAQGTFRQDLLYRINAFPIHLPALHERPQDIALLAQALLRRALPADRTVRIDDEAAARLCAHAWPGNIRELRNVLERAMLFADDGVIRARDLPPELTQAEGMPVRTDLSGNAAWHGNGRARWPDDAALRTLAREFPGTRKALATHLGCSERTLYRRLRALGLA